MPTGTSVLTSNGVGEPATIRKTPAAATTREEAMTGRVEDGSSLLGVGPEP